MGREYRRQGESGEGAGVEEGVQEGVQEGGSGEGAGVEEGVQGRTPVATLCVKVLPLSLSRACTST